MDTTPAAEVPKTWVAANTQRSASRHRVASAVEALDRLIQDLTARGDAENVAKVERIRNRMLQSAR